MKRRVLANVMELYLCEEKIKCPIYFVKNKMSTPKDNVLFLMFDGEKNGILHLPINSNTNWS